ncbi:HNH endonuclease signature motif containing protein [Pseudomonas lactucae]|uniref:HNH endonuclease signature motif containing protein n=1 Tax=Pseudomonas lactucae TaxID=2813360 RepID=UPI002FCD1C3D
MHYFRVMRNGTTDKLPTSRQQRVITPNGYIRVYEPGHALADKGGYVFEHRHVMWAEVGPGCRDCELCGKHETWLTCHVDHIDENRQNNERSNLRILCRGCNTRRGFTQESYASLTDIGLIEFEGVRKTATQWGEDPRVAVAGATVMRRKRSGMSDFEALFGRKITHNGRKPLPSPRKTNHKHERSNAVAITIEGYTLTASEWSREPGVTVSVRSIVNRIREGLDPIDAVFARPGKKPIPIEQLKAITAEYRAKTRELKRAAA